MPTAPVCNEDCFNCPYPDCIREDLTLNTYQNLKAIEKDFIAPPTAKEKRLAAQKRAYYEKNKEKKRICQMKYRFTGTGKIVVGGYGNFTVNGVGVTDLLKNYFGVTENGGNYPEKTMYGTMTLVLDIGGDAINVMTEKPDE